VDDLPDGGITNFRNYAPGLRKTADKKRSIDQDIAKIPSPIRAVRCDVSNNGFQISQRLRSEDYRAAHESTNLRASSAGIPSPRFACSRAT
jgi:hypothetical protein